jgi:hypothetical protein
MGEIRPVEERIAQAERRWPSLSLRRTGNEAFGPCPRCGGTDRFRVFEDGGFWCRQCNDSGWLDDNQDRRLTEAELTAIRLRSLEYRQAEHERRLSVLEQMHGLMHVADFYHGALRDANNDAFEYWITEGVEIETIGQYKLGYCSRCPTDHDRRPSYTIPVIIKGKLFNIRHRLIGGDQGDKYRPHLAGLPSVLFNADHLYDAPEDRIVITEGEKKSIIAAQAGFPNVGIMGKAGFDPAWVVRFARFKRVYVALDPDATEQATKIAALFQGRGRVVSLYDKLDDMIVKYGATPDDIEACLQQGRPV